MVNAGRWTYFLFSGSTNTNKLIVGYLLRQYFILNDVRPFIVVEILYIRTKWEFE